MLGHGLPVGTRIADHTVEGLIGEGGFGIVYLAVDHALDRRVALKEYMPAAIASRAPGSSRIEVTSERHAETFRAGLRSFVNEARLLARFDHPALVKVFRFWEANGTAYMGMPYYEGPTLKAALADLGRPPTEEELRDWLAPLVDALAVLHAARCYHRDIAPDNILLTPRGPLLLDFGAARRVIGDRTQALTVVLKPGFAPIEQYGDAASMAQGAWTDFYALASVVRFAITGEAPTSAVERLMDDRLEPLAALGRGRYSARFLAGLDHALAVRPADRPQDARAFREALGLPEAAPAAVVTVPAPLDGPEGDDTERDPGAPTDVLPRSGGDADRATTAPWHAPTRVATDAPPSAPHAPASTRTQLEVAAALGGAFGGTFGAPPAGDAPTDRPTSVPARAPAPTAPVHAPPPAAAAPAPARAPRRPAWPWIGAGAAGLLLLGGLVAVLDRPARPGTVADGVSSAPAAAAATAAAPVPVVAAPRPAERPAPSPAPVPTAERPSADAPAGPVPRPAAVPAVAAADPVAPSPSPSPSARRDVRAEGGATTPRPVRPAPAATANAERCSDILRKGSLEPLTADEAAYLRSTCR